jgi:Amt family ammonium transporter
MSFVLCLLCILLVPFATAGLTLMHQGLGRSRSAAHTMVSTLCVLAVTALVFVIVGFSVAGVNGGAAHIIGHGSAAWDWAGAEPLFARGVHFDGSTSGLLLCFQIFAAGLAAIIPLSTGSDRWRLGPACVSTGLLAAITFPLFAHWAWNGGWLSHLGLNFGLGAGFLDAGGSGVIHVIGGFTALSIAWILGPRRGKFHDDGMAAAIPGHNIVLVLFGCLLALIGWIALNSAASMLFFGAGIVLVPKVLVNTMLAASASCLATVLTTRLRYGKPDASLIANGWVAGLVAGSAGSVFISPAAAITTGFVAGAGVMYLVEFLELKLHIDDPGGAISVHAGAGLWGLLAAGFFSSIASFTRGGQIMAQVIGIAALLGFMLPLIHGLNLLVNRFMKQRVDADGDRQGMDVRELGAGAYPEFVVHGDEFLPH